MLNEELQVNSDKSNLLKNIILEELNNLLGIIRLFDEDLNEIHIHKLSFKDKLSKTDKNEYSSSIKQIGAFEPRLELVYKTARSLFDLVYLYDESGKMRNPFGMKLRNLEDWVTSSKMDPNHGNVEWDILKYLSEKCGVECEFCLHKSDPPGYYTNSCKWQGSICEIEERINYFNPNNKEALFSEFTYGSYEKISHPKLFEILQKIREKSDAPISIITNGSDLKEDIINRLKKYEPISLIVSLNSSSKEVRLDAMNDITPNYSIQSLELLQKKQIPFIISLTHWYKSSCDDLYNTIEFANSYSPYIIRINLEGYSKYHPLYRKYDLFSHWNQVVDTVRSIRPRIKTPIVFQPVMYEENQYNEEVRPIIKGIIQNSPSYFTDLKTGDEILKINNKNVTYRKTVKNVLRFMEQNADRIHLEIKRNNKIIQIEIMKSAEAYPYYHFFHKLGMDYPWGIVLSDSLDPLAVKAFIKLAGAYNNVLLLSSTLVKPSFEIMYQDLNKKDIETKLHIAIPKNHFLGEDVIIGDLLTVDDFIRGIREWIIQNDLLPDIIVIPATVFSAWGKDITGKSYRHIQRIIKIPVILLETDRIWSLGG